MTRIGLLSDTHGWLDPRIKEHFADRDIIWHAGDLGPGVAEELAAWKPLVAVHGNIDDARCRATYPEHQRFNLEGVRVWMTHIAGKPPRYTPEVLKELLTCPTDLFICGHSHICSVRFDEPVNCLYMNPGAAGRHGWHQVRTLLRFELEAGKVLGLEVIELGKRGAD
ncbi:MAG: metallophosphoesterase family protein [Flavobacteriales bacterium]